MAFDSVGPLNYLKTTLAGIAGVNQTYKGVPESIGRRVSAIVAVGGQRLEFEAMRVVARDAGYFVEFAYRIAENDEGTAEDTLAGFLDAFLVALYADQTLGGTCEWIDLDFGLMSDPSYRPTAGQEFRIAPLMVWARQTNDA